MHKFRWRFWLVLACFILGLTHAVVCQSKVIERDDFSDAFMKSDPMGRYNFWRSVYERTYFSAGKRTDIKSIFEYISQKKWREVDTKVSDDKTTISEVIYLNGTYFCRTDDKPWRKAAFNCSSGPGTGWLPPDYQGEGTASVEDAVLDKTPVKLYKFRVTYKEADGTERLYERKVWVNLLGQRLKAEAQIGTVPGNVLTDRYQENYAYGVSDMRIVAPIK